MAKEGRSPESKNDCYLFFGLCSQGQGRILKLMFCSPSQIKVHFARGQKIGQLHFQQSAYLHFCFYLVVTFDLFLSSVLIIALF